MKKVLMAAIAVFMMSGVAVAADNMVVVDNNVTTVQSGNVGDKFIALIKSYTNKINAVKSIDELVVLSEKCYEDMMAFEEKYADEIESFQYTMSEAQMAAYEKKFEAAISELDAAVEKKTEQLLNSYDVSDYDF